MSNSGAFPSRDHDDAPELSIVLPAHNEEILLSSTVNSISTGLANQARTFEILIVENGSTDKTRSIADSLAHDNSHVHVTSLPKGNYGEALSRGIDAASGQYVVTFDVDLFDMTFLDTAYVLLQSSDVGLIVASKRAPDSHDERPLTRRLLTASFALVLKLLIDLPVTDAHGMKMMRRDQLAPIARECVMRGSLFDIELVTVAGRDGIGIGELPITVRELRPPRTGIVRRSVESLRGAVKLRGILRNERLHTVHDKQTRKI